MLCVVNMFVNRMEVALYKCKRRKKLRNLNENGKFSTYHMFDICFLQIIPPRAIKSNCLIYLYTVLLFCCFFSLSLSPPCALRSSSSFTKLNLLIFCWCCWWWWWMKNKKRKIQFGRSGLGWSGDELDNTKQAGLS